MVHRISRRAFLIRSASLAMGAVLVACAKATPTPTPKSEPTQAAATAVPPTKAPPTATPEPTKVPPTATPAGPKLCGLLVIPRCSAPPGLDPCNPWNLGSGMQGLGELPYDPWVIYDRNIKRTPYVAQSISRPSPDTVMVEIRPGVKFHSGREFTAEDAVWSYERYINKDLGCAGAQDYVTKQIVSMKAVDKYKLEVKLANPKLWTEKVWLPPILDREVVEKYTKGPILLQAEGGTGPWILKEWAPQSFISFKRNADYWDKPPLLEEIRFVVMPDQQAQVAALKAGQINFLGFGDYKVYDQLKDDPSISIFSFLTGSYYRLNVNHLRPALKDPNVLQALRYGINRQQMVDTITRGKGVVSGPVTPLSKGYALPQEEINELQKYDPELAKSYLAKSGYDPKNKRLELVCITIAGWQTFQDIALITQANLREIGIDLEVRIQEIGVWVKSRLERKDYDLSPNDHFSAQVDPDLGHYRSDRDEQKWTGGGDPELDKLIDAFDAEPDPQKRMQISQEQQRLLIKNVRELYLFAAPTFQAVSKKLVGYEPWPGSPGTLRALDWEQVYWKE